ncbi:MAG: type II toxin-antitoxin system RelE/ParE family toxin [Bryobacteraceae bacterium]|jgi:plasmid stabilization system protein ParE
MAYRVEFTGRAARDLQLLFHSIGVEESDAALRGLDGMERAIATLNEFPNRCSLAPESRPGCVIRQLLHGSGRYVYRILFRVTPKPRAVVVLHIRHGARLPDV